MDRPRDNEEIGRTVRNQARKETRYSLETENEEDRRTENEEERDIYDISMYIHIYKKEKDSTLTREHCQLRHLQPCACHAAVSSARATPVRPSLQQRQTTEASTGVRKRRKESARNRTDNRKKRGETAKVRRTKRANRGEDERRKEENDERGRRSGRSTERAKVKWFVWVCKDGSRSAYYSRLLESSASLMNALALLCIRFFRSGLIIFAARRGVGHISQTVLRTTARRSASAGLTPGASCCGARRGPGAYWLPRRSTTGFIRKLSTGYSIAEHCRFLPVVYLVFFLIRRNNDDGESIPSVPPPILPSAAIF